MGDIGPGESARELVQLARAWRDSASGALDVPKARRRDARKAYNAIRDDIVKRQLRTIPIARLRETTQGRVRLGAVEKAGFHTAADVLAAGPGRLRNLPGVGEHTATQVIAAARQLKAAMAEAVRIRFDPDQRPATHTELLRALQTYEDAERAIAPLRQELADIASVVDRLAGNAERASRRLSLLFSSRGRRAEAHAALTELDLRMRQLVTPDLASRLKAALDTIHHPRPNPALLWNDYEARAVAYNGLLIDIGELAPDLDAAQGFVPREIAAKVQEHPLDTSLLAVSLRGYQAFGAKFALVQRRAILGDEMGTGKTIEALAAMCHLTREGETHFIVVCPASVLVNWAHEVQRHSKLAHYRLHGLDRGYNLKAWARQGGVAITTYDSLRAISKPSDVNIAMLVVDEAHYTKNPATQRAQSVQTWIARTDRSLFLTGTPMENRVEEFRVLVDYLQPSVAVRVNGVDGLAGAATFRKAVAPVYLRRNQADVLEELPPRIETEEWVQLSGDDEEAYWTAVASGNFMAMRRAPYLPGTARQSAKLGRLTEIAEEAASNGRKIVVFSYFRDVLDSVRSVLGDLAIGPLTGSVAPVARQLLVDEFTDRRRPAVLVSQIEAGGVGLNLQAASVVILAEPQWKPTVEDQAIGRCHRMGQVRPVDVHRLLAESSADQRMLEVLATKRILFDRYVRRSELKEVSPDAVDVSDADATREVVSQAEAERRIVEIERKRLGIDPTIAPDRGLSV